jgi:hypothetical protein
LCAPIIGAATSSSRVPLVILSETKDLGLGGGA